jgi:hypothetical protein
VVEVHRAPERGILRQTEDGGPAEYREYSRVRQRRAGGEGPVSARSDFRHGLLRLAVPFTPAHPAAAVPLSRWLRSPSALAIGAMLPDLAYFIPLGVSGAQSHSLAGIAWFCVPAGVTSYFLLHLLIRPLLVCLAPSWLRQRLNPEWATPSLPRQRSGFVVASIAAGALTHLAWDSFTHASGFVVAGIPALSARVPLLPGYNPAVFTVLQHASTLLGLSLLAWWGYQWLLSRSPSEQELPGVSSPTRVLFVLLLLLPPLLVGLASGWPRFSQAPSAFRGLQLSVSKAIFSGGSVFLVALIAVSSAWRWCGRAGWGGSGRCPTTPHQQTPRH